MLLNRKELIQAIKFLLPAIGQNESRRALMNLYVEKKENRVFLTTANAYIIKCAYVQVTGQEKNFKPFMIPRQILIYYRQMLNNSPELVCDINRSELKADDISIKYKQPLVDYPALSGLITGDIKDGGNTYKEALKKNIQPIGLNANFIKDMLTGFGPYDVVKMEIGEPNTPVRYTSKCGNFIAIQMPVKIDW